MTGLFKTALSLSLSGTLLIAAFFLFKPLWKDRLSKQWQYYIWLIVAARLLLPFAPQANLAGAIFQRLEASGSPVLQAGQGIPETPGVETGIQAPDAGGSDPGAGDENPAASGPSPAQDALALSRYIPFVWLVAALLLLVRKITIYQGFARYIKAGQTPVDDVDVLNRLGLLAAEMGLKKNIELSVNPLISSPLIIGFFRPCIVLPDKALANTDFCCTIRHELTHYKRRDMLYKWLVQLVICIHWFNPFVYLMGREISRACELSCDEAVIRHMDADGKAAYGDTLLNAMETGGSYKDSLACATLYESQKNIKERLECILKYRDRPKLPLAVSAVLTVSLCLGAAAAGAYEAGPAIAEGGIHDSPNPLEPVAAQQESTSGEALLSKGYWRYFDYYYYRGMLFGVGWRERDSIEKYSTKIHVQINQVEYPVVFMDRSEELKQDEDLHAFLTSCISAAIESGWGQEQPVNGFWAVSHVYTGRTPDEVFESVMMGNDTLAAGLVMPYVKQETVEKYIRYAFEKRDTSLMMILLSEASDIFKINIDAFASRAIEDGDMGMYIILEPYISAEQSAEFKEKAKGRFFTVPDAAVLPDLPALPPLPPLPPLPANMA